MKKNISMVLSFLLVFNSLSLAKPKSSANHLSKKIADHIQLKFKDKKNLKDLLHGLLADSEFEKDMIKLAEKKKIYNQPLPQMSVSLEEDGVKFVFEKTYELSFKEADQSLWMNGQRIKMKNDITAEELFTKMRDALNPNKTSLLSIFVQPAHAIEPLTITIIVIASLAAILAAEVATIVYEDNEMVKDYIKKHAKIFLQNDLRDLECTDDGSNKYISRPTRFKFRDVTFDVTYGENGKVAEVKFLNCVLNGYQNGDFQVPPDCEDKVENFTDKNLNVRAVFISHKGRYHSTYLRDIKNYCSLDPETKIFQTEQASFVKAQEEYALEQKRNEETATQQERQRIKDASTLVKPQAR